MANDLEVLIEMLPWLVANNGAALSEISEHFDITDKYALALIGQLVVTGPDQGGGGLVDIDFEDSDSIYVSDAKSLDRPIKFSSFEAMSLLGGLHYLEQFPHVADSSVVSGLISKIQSLIPSVENSISVVAQNLSPEITESINQAIKQNRAIGIDYAAISKDDISHRIIDPSEVYVRDDFAYLRAWCRESQAWRNFRIDRIMGCTETKLPSNLPEVSPELEATQDYLAAIELDKAHYGQLDQVEILSFKEYMWHAVEVEMKVYSREWLISMILASGGRIRALRPPDLISGLIERAQGWE
jgi:proteasome accessory factor C